MSPLPSISRERQGKVFRASSIHDGVVNHADVLAKIAGFRGHDCWRFLNALSDLMAPATFLPGEDLIVSGSAVQRLFFLRRGEVEVLTPDGVRLETLKDNSMIGEWAILGEGAHVATVRAIEFSDCRTVTVTAFKQVLRGFPKVRERLSELFTERAEKIDIAAQLQRHVGDRLIRVLHRRSTTTGDQLQPLLQRMGSVKGSQGSEGQGPVSLPLDLALAAHGRRHSEQKDISEALEEDIASRSTSACSEASKGTGCGSEDMFSMSGPSSLRLVTVNSMGERRQSGRREGGKDLPPLSLQDFIQPGTPALATLRSPAKPQQPKTTRSRSWRTRRTRAMVELTCTNMDRNSMPTASASFPMPTLPATPPSRKAI